MPKNKSQSILTKLYRQQRLLQIGVFSLVTVMIWMGFGLLRSQRTTSITKELRDLALPLTPDIDTQVLQEIQQKRAYSENELSDFPIYKIIISEENQESSVVTIETNENEFLGITPSPSPSALDAQLQSLPSESEPATDSASESTDESTNP